MLSASVGLVFVLFASFIPDTRGQCRKLRFTIGSRHGQRLENHVIRTTDAISEDICQVKCLLEPNCVSYNYKTEANTGRKHNCDLNNATYEHDNEHSGDLVKKENYVYRGAKNTCAKNPCQNNSTCRAGFTDRDYQCLCIAGFTGHDCEVEVNECTKGTHNCDANAVCNSTQRSYNCTCKDGFYGDGKTCQDIDECTNATRSCDVNAVCKTTGGSNNCLCKDGFDGDGVNCTDIDECANGKHRCDINAVCNNTRGSYNCTCKDGFHGDGINCTVPDPVALYPLDGVHDTKEINNRVGAGVASGVHIAPGPDGKPNGSYEFFGTVNSFIEFPNGGVLDVKNSMTMLCWLYPGGQDGPLFNYRENGSWGVHLWVEGGQLFARFNKRDYSFTLRLRHTPLKRDGWKFVGASYDQASGHAKLWVDGKAVQTVNIGANLQLATQDSVRMGVKKGDDRYFKGRIAQMQVFNVALTQEQIKFIKDRTLSR